MDYDPQWEEVSFQEWAMRLACEFKIAGADLTARVSQFFDSNGQAFEALIDTPRMQRLSGRRQFGERRYRVEDSGASLLARPFPHTRLTHVQQVAAHVLPAGLWLSLCDRDLKTLVCAALLHDVDHPVFSHTGDRWLMRELRLADHEERACQTVCTDVEIRSALRQLDVRPEDVASVIREQGTLGRILSLVDTLAYVQLDGRIMGLVRPRNLRFGVDVLMNLVAVCDSGFTVKRIEPMQDVLNLRHRLFDTLYNNVPSRAGNLVAELLLSAGHAQGLVTELDVRFLSCTTMEQRMRAELAGQTEWLQSAIDILLCGWNAAGPWKVTLVQTEAEVTDLRADHQHTLVSPPMNTRSKTYVCWVTGDAVQELTAHGAISGSRTQYLVLTYEGV